MIDRPYRQHKKFALWNRIAQFVFLTGFDPVMTKVCLSCRTISFLFPIIYMTLFENIYEIYNGKSCLIWYFNYVYFVKIGIKLNVDRLLKKISGPRNYR